MWKLWDVHEMGYIIFGLTSDYPVSAGNARWRRRGRPWITSSNTGARCRPNGSNLHSCHAVNMYATGLEAHAAGALRPDRRPAGISSSARGNGPWPTGTPASPSDRAQGTEGHVYAYLTRCLAQLDLYHFQPDEKLLRATRRAMHFLTAEDGMVITGAGRPAGIFHRRPGRRGNAGRNVRHDLPTSHLGQPVADGRRIPLWRPMERTIYNHLFASQSPDGRQIRYYTSLEGSA